MLFPFLSGLFITLFLLLGAWAFYGFWDLKKLYYPLSWHNYQHVIVLAVIAVLCFILAVVFGTLIPDCYGC